MEDLREFEHQHILIIIYNAGFATNPITPRAPITGRASCPLSRESNNQTLSTLDSLGKASITAYILLNPGHIF